jgi:hypothetical protein
MSGCLLREASRRPLSVADCELEESAFCSRDPYWENRSTTPVMGGGNDRSCCSETNRRLRPLDLCDIPAKVRERSVNFCGSLPLTTFCHRTVLQ